MENPQDSSNKYTVDDVMVKVGEETSAANGESGAEGAAILSAGRTESIRGRRHFFMNIRHILKLDDLGREVAGIVLPAALALAADPLASLVETAFVGRLGSVELAAMGVSIAIINQVSKVAIYPLVSVTTSFVAEEEALRCDSHEEKGITDMEKDDSSVSKALIIGAVQAFFRPSFSLPRPNLFCALWE